MKHIFFFTALFIASLCVYGAHVDTVNIHSNCMKKDLSCVYIKPDTYRKKKLHFPVVYLLHGYSGRYDSWIKRVPSLMDLSDRMQVILVCPDGGYSSWYFDSPIDSSSRYETYITSEVVPYTDAHYRTLADRKHRAITGLSMGGHGAMYLALRHSDLFGAVGSMSGGLDLRPFAQHWDIALRIGDTINYSSNWERMSVIHMLEVYPANELSIIIDCGTEDFFYTINASVHHRLLELGIPHDYIERPGAHDWSYWTNAVAYQLLFFRNYFSSVDASSKP